jgi:outer membrane protein assembly factor BamA
MRRAAYVVAILCLSAAAAAQTPVVETLGEVRVHGNHTTPDADILGLAGLTVGAPITEQTLRDATDRLQRSGRFADVELRKRYRSIDNPADVLVIVLVDESIGVSEGDLTPGPLKKLRGRGMWLPIMNYADGYGFTYGARMSFVNTLGGRSRISLPFTWGGQRRAAVEADRTFDRGPFSRVAAAVDLTRRENPFFGLNETRTEVRARGERALTSWLRVGGGARLTNVRFAELDETYTAPGVDLLVDTRTDPVFPRNALHATAGVEQLRFDRAEPVVRWSSDVRGYIGLLGSSVLAVRAASIRANAALPPYELALLGGTSTLRGYDFGYRAGDSLAVLSAEFRLPITSPITLARLGIKAFVDAGTVYDAGASLWDQQFDRGAGGGAFMTWTVLSAGLDVAWPLQGSNKSARWHFGLGVTF